MRHLFLVRTRLRKSHATCNRLLLKLPGVFQPSAAKAGVASSAFERWRAGGLTDCNTVSCEPRTSCGATLVPLSLVPLSLVPLSLVPLSLVPLSLVPLSRSSLSLVPLSLVPLSLVPLSLVLGDILTSPVVLGLVLFPKGLVRLLSGLLRLVLYLYVFRLSLGWSCC